MLELCSYKPFGLLCSLLNSVLNVLWCHVNKLCLNHSLSVILCLMLELCSYKPYGLLCSWLNSVLNVLRCLVNKPCVNQICLSCDSAWQWIGFLKEIRGTGEKVCFHTKLNTAKSLLEGKPTELAHSVYFVRVSVSVFTALSTVFHSINSPDNSPLSQSVLPVL